MTVVLYIILQIDRLLGTEEKPWKQKFCSFDDTPCWTGLKKKGKKA